MTNHPHRLSESAVVGGSITELVDAETIVWDAAASLAAKVTLGGDRTLASPTNLVPGSIYVLSITQDDGGNRLVVWDVAYKFAAGTYPVLSTGGGQTDLFFFYSDGEFLTLLTKALNVYVPVATPTNGAASSTEVGQITLTWTNNAVGAETEVQRLDGLDWFTIATVGVGVAVYVDVVDPLGPYDYRLVATRGGVESVPSATIHGTTFIDAPSDLVGSNDQVGYVALTWTGNSTIQNVYNVYRSDGGPFSLIGTSNFDVTGYTDTIDPGTYQYRVTAANAGGESLPSNTANGTSLP